MWNSIDEVPPMEESSRENIPTEVTPARSQAGGDVLRYGNLGELVRKAEEGGLDGEFVNVKKISRRSLIDRLHFLNFSEGEVSVVFRHPRYDEIIVRTLRPEPCLEHSFIGRWTHPGQYQPTLRDGRVLCFFISNRREMILARSEKKAINEREMELTLPEYGFEILLRSSDRFPCPPIEAELVQNGVLFPGVLEVFSVKAFQVSISGREGISLKWINPEQPVHILFREGGEVYYSGDCRIIRQWESTKTRTLILQPDTAPIHRYKRREYRSPRQILHPAPGVSYVHPLIKKMIRLNACDLSTSGLSVEEEAESSTLLPGMVIPDLRIEWGGAPALTCKAQVVYQIPQDPPKVKTGFTILNISDEDYIKLTNLVNQSLNNHVEICGPVEPESLWRFFFQSGFIYPQKYHVIRQNKEEVKRVYEKIYRSPSEIERHVTYQENGELLGHISMLRVYDRTWMLHHFTAAPSSRPKRVALTLLQQIERYIIDAHYFESTRMDNIICYFRPENKFPNMVFGGAARYLKDPQICSLERFAYLSYPMILDARQGELSQPWSLTPSTAEDLKELAYFYQHISGGQMLKALDLAPERLGDERLNQVYRRSGLLRERRLFSVKRDGQVKAVISLLRTDLGLNLSELTNCPTFFVLDTEQFPFEIFLRTLAQLEAYDPRQTIPVLIYPWEYVERQKLRIDRTYDMWIFAVENSDRYFQYIRQLFSRLLP